MRIALLFITNVLLVFDCPAFASAGRCSELFQTPSNSESRVAPIFAALENVNPRSMLSQEFIKQLEDSNGPLSIKVWMEETAENGNIHFQLRSGDTPVTSFFLYPYGRLWIVEGLRIENPLNKKTELRVDQNRKGMPFSEFRRMDRRISEALLSAGVESVMAGGFQSYTVLNLYRRALAMSPATSESREYIDMLDRYYRFARTELVGNERVKSMEEFDKLIGGNLFGNQSTFTDQMVRDYLLLKKNGSPKNRLEILTDADQTPLAVRFHLPDGKTQIVFIDILDPQAPLFSWGTTHLFSYLSKGHAFLVRQIQ